MGSIVLILGIVVLIGGIGNGSSAAGAVVASKSQSGNIASSVIAFSFSLY